MRVVRRVASAAVLLLGASSLPASAHELPSFPRVRLLSALEHPWEPASRILVVEVLDPAGREPLVGAQVHVSGIEKERGSALRVPEQWLAPTPRPGVYQGQVEFPGRGVWELTVTVKGRHVGEAHFQMGIGDDLARGIARGGQPELHLGWQGWTLLLLDWGHLVGFGLWLGVTAAALGSPRLPPRSTVALTWLALAVAIGTGFNKLEYGTPFARGLSVFRWDLPPVFFGREYVSVLAVKHVLILGAVAVTAGLTRQAWRRTTAGAAAGVPFRRLLLVNLLLALAVGGAAAVLGLLHAIVLHFA